MLVNFLMVEVLDASHNVILEVDWHYVWYGCQQCQGLETFGCFWENTFRQVSESINCSYIWSSPSPSIYMQPFPKTWHSKCGVWFCCEWQATYWFC
jgi:hypothetical protein